MGVRIGSTTGYLLLDSWTLSKILQLSTFKFCYHYFNRRNDPDGKQFGQTTGAARAVPANIAEGSARHQTSIETEMRLLDVARASLSELLDDYMFVLLSNGQTVWPEDDPRSVTLRNIRLDEVYFERSFLHAASVNVLEQKKKFDPWTENEDPMICANALIVLCTRVKKMLGRQLTSLLEEFRQNGGFTENMTQTRLQSKREHNAQTGAPRCPICGEPMELRTVKKGERQGQRFWGCIAWRKTGCQGTMPYNEEGGK